MVSHTLIAQHRTPFAFGTLVDGALAAGPVLHLFRVDALAADEVAGIASVLSADEQERAARFRFDRDRTMFVVARAALRQVLAVQTQIAPEQLTFDYNAYGKPALDGVPLHFNVSHGDGVVAIALCRDGRIGVDVERVAPERAALDAAQRYFAAAEWQALQACADAVRHDRFFVLWTIKEAFVKANDQGLSIPLDSFTMMVADDSSVIQLQNAPDGCAANWQFATGTVFGDYRWSVALEWAPETQPALALIEYR